MFHGKRRIESVRHPRWRYSSSREWSRKTWTALQSTEETAEDFLGRTDEVQGVESAAAATL